MSVMTRKGQRMAASASKGSAVFAGQITQIGLNTDTWVQIPTGIDPGSATVIELESLEVFFRNSQAAIPGTSDALLMCSVSRSPVVPSLANTDVFGMVAITNIGAVGALGPAVFNPMAEIDLEPALTLQPYIYVCVSSVSLGSAAVVDYRVTYVTSKVGQSEQLKLLAGGI